MARPASFGEREFQDFVMCGLFEHGATRFRCERCRREPWSGSRASGVLGTRGGHDAVAGEQPTTHLPWRGRARRVVMYGRVEPGPAVLAPPLGERNGIGVKRRSRAWNWSAFRDQRSRLSPLCSPDTPDRHHPRSRCQSRDPRSWGHLPSGQSPAPPHPRPSPPRPDLPLPPDTSAADPPRPRSPNSPICGLTAVLCQA
jgi:hypothetical protein